MTTSAMNGDGDTVRFTAPLLIWQNGKHGGIGWTQIEGEAAEAVRAHELIRRLELGQRRGFGSVKVNVTIGGSRWTTSAFPQKEGGWFLPVKKAVMRAEDVAEGDLLDVQLELL